MTTTKWKRKPYITTWKQFNNTDYREHCQLLTRLKDFPGSILVTGCQRSGTTMLSRLLTRSEGLNRYWFSPDDELDAALILSGHVEHKPSGRYCFQTTYVNTCFHEYFEQTGNFKVIWVLRTPFSVVHSMLYNWHDEALEELFNQCAIPSLTGLDKWRYRLLGSQGVSRLRKACWAYAAKTAHLFRLSEHLEPGRLMVVDYDDLVTQKEVILPAIYDFVNLSYRSAYADEIFATSINKKGELSSLERKTVGELCQGIYEEAKKLITEARSQEPRGRASSFPISREERQQQRQILCESHLQSAFDAFILEETERGQEHLRHAVQADRSILDVHGKRLREWLINHHLQQGDNEGHSLERIFAQLPAELTWLSQTQTETVARGCLYRGIQSIIEGRPDRAGASLSRAVQLGAKADSEFKWWLLQLLSKHESENGSEQVNERLYGLAHQLQSFQLGFDMRRFIGDYRLDRAFRSYRCQQYSQVPEDVVEAVKVQPRHVVSRGLWSILLRSLIYKTRQAAT